MKLSSTVHAGIRDLPPVIAGMSGMTDADNTINPPPRGIPGRSCDNGCQVHVGDRSKRSAVTPSFMGIDVLRKEISGIDREIIVLIGKRQRIAAKMARAKAGEGVSVHDPARVKEVLDDAFDCAVEEQIDPVAVQEIIRILISMSEARQRECLGEGNLP